MNLGKFRFLYICSKPFVSIINSRNKKKRKFIEHKKMLNKTIKKKKKAKVENWMKHKKKRKIVFHCCKMNETTIMLGKTLATEMEEPLPTTVVAF